MIIHGIQGTVKAECLLESKPGEDLIIAFDKAIKIGKGTILAVPLSKEQQGSLGLVAEDRVLCDIEPASLGHSSKILQLDRI